MRPRTNGLEEFGGADRANPRPIPQQVGGGELHVFLRADSMDAPLGVVQGFFR